MPVRLITGCSSGFGEAIALAFAARGDIVVASMRNPANSPPAFRACDTIECIALDVTDETSRASALDHVLSRHGRIDTLVNNAGIVANASVEDTAEDVSRRIFETNYFGPLALMRAALPIMRKQGGGRIVNVTAIGALISTPLMGAYCASKHALDAISAVIDMEARPYGVRAPSVLPGQFRTPIMTKEPPVITEPYQNIANALQAVRKERSADVLDDLSAVALAVVAAATDPEPQLRYLAGIGQLMDALAPAADAIDELDRFSAKRCGI